MEILPPRRPGQLGAFRAGPGTQGPSGGFSVAASSTARSTGTKPVTTPQAKGSVAPAVTRSVSEEVSIKASTSATAARSTVPNSKGDVFGKPAVVAVKSYAPPANTPAITQPAPLPNSSATVKALANQIPQTPAQVVQKVLARDAGIAVPVKGPPPIVPPPGLLPKVIPVPAPKLNPAVMESAIKASGATIGAKLAEQKAITTSVAAANVAARLDRLKTATDVRADELKRTASTAQKTQAELASAATELSITRASQTASDDAKAKAEEKYRTALAEQARVEEELKKSQEQLRALQETQAKAEAEAKATAAAAEKAREEANKKNAEALKEQAVAIDNQMAANSGSAQAGSGGGIVTFSSGGGGGGGAVIDSTQNYTGQQGAGQGQQGGQQVEDRRRMLPEEGVRAMPMVTPPSGVPGWAKAVGALAAVGVVVYAWRRSKSGGAQSSNAPLIIEELEKG